ESLIGKRGKNQKQFNEVNLDEQKEYAVEDADITWQLKAFFAPQLPDVNAQKLFEDIEMPLMEVLSEMEIEGIRLDKDVLAEQSLKINRDILELEKKVYADAGEEFNLNSPKQLGDILFDKLNIDSKAKKTKTGQYATGE